MGSRLLTWIRSETTPRACAELFALGNLAFLAVDVYIAHSSNSFALSAEWIPVVFSLIAPVALLVMMALQRGLQPPSANQTTLHRSQIARDIGLCVGGISVLVGIAGLLWHLNSAFFEEATVESLVYTAPFIAPLAYAGVGLLLLVNRMASQDSDDWSGWVVLLALGGFLGNFILSLADHAQNGFFEEREWIPVAAAAIAVGNLSAVVFLDRSPESLTICAWLLLLQIGVGVLGVYYHLQTILVSEMDSPWDKILYGAPVFAPLLFADLAILALIGVWSLWRRQLGLDPISSRMGDSD
jgi:hypothetical protein